MILKNPTDSNLSVVYNGKQLSVEAQGTVEVSEQEAKFWRNIHAFLQVLDSEQPRVEQETTTSEAEPEALVQVATEEKVVKPKTPRKPRATKVTK